MTVPAREFSDWLKDAGLPARVGELSSFSGLKRTTIQNQRLRGRVTVQTVIATARAARLNPLDALGSFAPYRVLIDERRQVTTAELVSQVSYSDVFVHLLSRIRTDFAHRLADVRLSEVPHQESVRTWVDAIDPGNLRRQVTERSGIAPSNFSTQLTENRLTPELGILVSHICGVSSTSGLVVSGLVTPDEAGWPIYGRENALLEMGDMELLDLASARLSSLRKATKKKVDMDEANNHYLETLG